MGSEGGKARKANLTPERRKEIAAAASKARWAKVKEKPQETPLPPPIDLPAPELAPIAPESVQVAPAPPQAPNRKIRKAVPKEFGKAHSYAEKRLATALKERAEYMQKVAMLNAEIPSLVQVIRALGGQVNPQALTMTMQGFPVPDGSMVPMQPTVELPQMPPDGIDPGLYRTNVAPIPGLPPPTAPIVPGAAMGGGMDLDYQPRDDEPAQPKAGGGWV
jgi:hypothetical protein